MSIDISVDSGPVDWSKPLQRSSDLFCVLEDFYVEEARLLDHGMMDEWLELLHTDVRYRIPVRSTQLRRQGLGVSETTNFMEDDYASLATRVRRLVKSNSAWSEDPPSRSRHFITNLRAVQRSDGDLEAVTYVLLMRNRGDTAGYEIVSGERSDTLRLADDGRPRLLSRVVLLDQSVLNAVNLALVI